MRRLTFLLFFVGVLACKKPVQQKSVSETLDEVVTRLLESFSDEEIQNLNTEAILRILSPEEKEVLATQYWKFDVNVPSKVYLMRHKKQVDLPFWLKDAGFTLTPMVVKNENYEYEVWEKQVPKGKVELGINGFDKHRPVYFVSIVPQNAEDKLTIIPHFPKNQHFEVMDVGAFTYHDWDGLTLTQVPEELKGSTLLTTIRGRAREAHLIQAFRKTEFPSSEEPDQIRLTWNDDPTRSVVVQYRTKASNQSGEVIYWKEGTNDTAKVSTVIKDLNDRLLLNDRYIHRHAAKLDNLSPNTLYHYHIVGSADTFQFTTAKPRGDFEFIWFGDTHNDKKWGEMLQKAHVKHPNHSFYIVAGDLVNTGLYRDDWDKFFAFADKSFATKPLMAIPGNHDSQDGLGPQLFRDQLSFFNNGPSGLTPGTSYHFTYQSAFYLMIDAATFSNEEQKDWIAEQLRNTKARWKMVYIHFPPFNEVEEYPEMVEKWVPIFDKNDVDLVMGGHFHYYLRTYPLRGGKKAEKGTIYMTSVGTSAAREAENYNPLVEKRIENGHFYQYVQVKDKVLRTEVYDFEGSLVDVLEIRKN